MDNYPNTPTNQFEPLEAQPEQAEANTSSCWMVLREVVETLVLAGILFLVINGLTARVRVDGPSMEPSFYDRDRLVVSKVSYWLGDIQRGDVIVFPAPLSPDEDYIKRVIGLPGDRIMVSGGYVYVNDVPINEPYIKAPPLTNMAEIVVPGGYVFVMGDNRNVSSDSRAWGPLPIEDIVGKAVFVYWPLSAIGIVEHYEFDVVEQTAASR